MMSVVRSQAGLRTGIEAVIAKRGQALMQWFESLKHVDGLEWGPPIQIEVDPVLSAMTPRPRRSEFAEPGQIEWATGDQVLDFMESPSSAAFSGLYGADSDEARFEFIIKALMVPGTLADYLDATVVGARNLSYGPIAFGLHQTAIAIIEADPSRARQALEAAGRPPDEIFVDAFVSAANFLVGQGLLLEANAMEIRAKAILGEATNWYGEAAADTLESLEEIAEARNQ